jgi:putative tryptophan/tyrosine transport system substrate-binding protein
MQRRQFITLLAGAAAVWPLAARAQQAALPVIGYLDPTAPDGDPDRLRGFRQGLKVAGLVEGESVAIVYRFAHSQLDRLPELAADLVRRRVGVIATSGNPATNAAKAATTTIPVVFVVGDDPVKQGLVASFARPGGNLTGINFASVEVAAKRLELTRALVPGTTRVAVLAPGRSSGGPGSETLVKDVEAAASTIGLQIRVLRADTSGEIDAAFAALVRERPDILLVSGGPFFASRRVQLVQLAAHHRVPATFSGREFAEVGGLMSYGANVADAFGQAGVYVGRILRGEKPADLPVVQASRFELVINTQTARMQGLSVPPTLLAIADEVIE